MQVGALRSAGRSGATHCWRLASFAVFSSLCGNSAVRTALLRTRESRPSWAQVRVFGLVGPKRVHAAEFSSRPPRPAPRRTQRTRFGAAVVQEVPSIPEPIYIANSGSWPTRLQNESPFLTLFTFLANSNLVYPASEYPLLSGQTVPADWGEGEHGRVNMGHF